MVCIGPLRRAGETYTDCTIEECLDAGGWRGILIGLKNFEVAGPNVEATFEDVFEDACRCERWDRGIKTKRVGRMGEFVRDLVQKVEAQDKLERQNRADV